MHSPAPQCLEWDLAEFLTDSLMLGMHVQVLFWQLENCFMHCHLHGISWTFVASVFATLSVNLSELFNKLPKVALNFLNPVPSTDVYLGDPIPSGCPSSFLMFQTQVKRGLSSWLALWFGLGTGMFFLPVLEFPKAANWVCLFPWYFKACPVPWLLGFWAALASDKSVEEKNPPEHRVLQPPAEEWPNPLSLPMPDHAALRCWNLFLPGTAQGRANFVGEALSVKASK